MDDLSRILMSQQNTKSLTGEQLAFMGKEAAAKYSSGAAPTMTEAVIEVVKTASLNPEQVRRVVEFANTDAFLHHFNKEGSAHRVIEFVGGPADPNAVIQHLNDGSAPSYVRGVSDYDAPPTSRTKYAAAKASAAAFQQEMDKLASEHVQPEEEPLTFRDVQHIRDKLAHVHAEAVRDLSVTRSEFEDLSGAITQAVKHAAIEGHSLSTVAALWSDITPDDEYVKLAFRLVTPDLLQGRPFRSDADVVDSLTKEAQVTGDVNPEHPLIAGYSAWAASLTKVAELLEFRDNLALEIGHVNEILKEATASPEPSAGLKSILSRSSKWLGEKVTGAGEHAAKMWHGQGVDPSTVSKWGKTTKTVAKGALGVAAALKAHSLYRDHMKYSPTVNGIMSHVPGTDAYYQREQMAQMGGNPGGYY